MSSLGAEDLIFYSDKDNNIHSGGFNVNSIILKNGLSPIVTLNQTGGRENFNQVSDLFQNLAVPNWALSLPTKKSTFFYQEIIPDKRKDEKEQEEDDEEEDYLEEDLHNKLLALIAPKEKEILIMDPKVKTKKNKINLLSLLKPKNKTKKHFNSKNSRKNN